MVVLLDITVKLEAKVHQAFPCGFKMADALFFILLQVNKQWGEASGSTASPKTTFPIAFSSAVYRIVNTFNKNNPIGDAYHMNECIPKNITTSSFTMWVDNETAAKFDYIAIGK